MLDNPWGGPHMYEYDYKYMTSYALSRVLYFLKAVYIVPIDIQKKDCKNGRKGT